VPFEFVAQPFEDGFHLRDFFELIQDEESIATLDVVVAWVKRTGLVEVKSNLDAFRARGGTIRAIAGISQGGTSRQGLELLRDIVDDAYVFHHSGRTFHPKVFLAAGDDRAIALVGSHNFTAGGVTKNYEAGILGDLLFGDEDDARFIDEIRDYVTRLLDDEEICRPLTTEFLAELITNPRYPLADEDAPKGTAEPVEGGVPADESEASKSGGPSLFGTSMSSMRATPKQPAGRPSSATPPAAGGLPLTPAAQPSPGPAPDPVVKRWFKRLPASDAQQLVGSNPSNTMTLVQARHPIDPFDYFRTEFFGSETWTTSETVGRGQAREVATIECEVIVRGVPLGTHVFDVRYTPGYDANQTNRTTELAWRQFGDYLRRHPLTSTIASLERTTSGRYQLIFDDTASGPFMY
jgi:hypothetical protein